MRVPQQHFFLVSLLLVSALAAFLYGVQTCYTATFDTGTIGLMAVNILQGDRPLFFYGQFYMGAIEAYVAAFWVLILGFSEQAVSLSPISFSLLWILASYLLFKELLDSRGGLIAATCTFFSGYYAYYYMISPYGGYPVVFSLGTLILWLTVAIVSRDHTSKRSLLLLMCIGFLSGIGLWTHFLIAPYLLTSFYFLLLHIIKNKFSFTLCLQYLFSASIAATGFFPYLTSPKIYYENDSTINFFFSTGHLKNSIYTLLSQNGPQLLIDKDLFDTFSPIFFNTICFLAILLVGILFCMAFFTTIKAIGARQNHRLLLPFIFLAFFFALYLPHEMAVIHAPRYLLGAWSMTLGTLWSYLLLLRPGSRTNVFFKIFFGCFLLFSAATTACFIYMNRDAQQTRAANKLVAETARHHGLTTVFLLGDNIFGLRGQLLSMFAENTTHFVSTRNERYLANAQLAETDENFGFLCRHNNAQTVTTTLRRLGFGFKKEDINGYTLFFAVKKNLPTIQDVAVQATTTKIHPFGQSLGKGENLTDRTLNTLIQWGGRQPKGLVIDLGSPRTITRIWLYAPSTKCSCENGSPFQDQIRYPEDCLPRSMKIEISDNGKDFTQISNGKDWIANGYALNNQIYLDGFWGKLEERLAPVKTQWIRLTFPETAVVTLDELLLFTQEERETDVIDVQRLLSLLDSHQSRFTLADRWISAQILSHKKNISDPHELPAIPRPNVRHDKRFTNRLVFPHSTLALVTAAAVADECQLLLHQQFGASALKKRLDLSGYTIFFFDDISMQAGKSLPLYWNGHSLLKLNAENRSCFTRELSAYGYPIFSPRNTTSKGFYHDFWTSGEAHLTGMEYQSTADEKFLVLHTYGWLGVLDPVTDLHLQLLFNNMPLFLEYRQGNHYYYRLPPYPRPKLTSITLRSDTFQPSSSDARQLGIDVDYLEIK